MGKDTKMPNYVVLVSTLGGLAVFGPNGFVIGPVTAALFIRRPGEFPGIEIGLVTRRPQAPASRGIDRRTRNPQERIG